MQLDNIQILDTNITSITGTSVNIEGGGVGSGSPGGISGFINNYVVADWGLSGSDYILDINHNLNTTVSLIQVYDNTNNDVIILKTERTSSNSIRLSVPADPDGRFNVVVIVR